MAKPSRRGLLPSRLDLLLVLALCGSFLAIVLPRWQRFDQESRLACLVQDLERFRRAVESYQADHGSPPGVRKEQVSSQILIEQLTHRTDAQGLVDPRGGFGPYLCCGIPFNPFNELDSVWLAETAVLPRPDGRTGWLFHLESGVVRANSQVVAGSEDQVVFDL